MALPAPAWLVPQLLHAVQHALAEHTAPTDAVAVALSGGADSAMLAAHAAHAVQLAGSGRPLCFFHVHHGLQVYADAWQAHVHRLALMLGVPCLSRCVQVQAAARHGVEAAARHARRAALADMAGQAGVGHLLLAHHQDDQAETVLLRLLRGAGSAGLAAMAPASRHNGLLWLRPWLDVPRSGILQAAGAFAVDTGWHPVDDPSNRDDAYTRSALRNRLVPHLNQRWPAWQATLGRHASQARETADLLESLAARLLAGLEPAPDGLSFSLRAWRLLTAAEQALVLRHWLQCNGLPMPSQARLNDWMRQLRQLHAEGHDRHMRVRHADAWVCCHKGRVVLQYGA